MSIISHCVIILEVTEPASIVPTTLKFKASKYFEIASSKGKGDPISVPGKHSVIRGSRGTRTFAVETYIAPFNLLTNISAMSSKNNSNKGSGESFSSEPGAKSTQHEPKVAKEEKHAMNVASTGGEGWTRQQSRKTKRTTSTSTPPIVDGGEETQHTLVSYQAMTPTAVETKPFVSGNPYVELTKGILHLHKDTEMFSINNPDAPRSEMLAMLSVPSTIECRDLIQYVAPFQADLEHIKIIRDTLPNQYMALLKFKTQKGADLFYKENNGTQFNSFEDDICKLAYVSKVETLRSTDEDAGLPLSGHIELPTCPVCLERMDESVDGVLTVLCNHTFHTNCLAKWSDSSCPVCRYVQTPEMVANNQCNECESSESLWICLICGHVGCGRYVQGHAYKHFCETEHCYAIQPDNNRVWDYIGDTFVHRLLQNKGDGKLVEVSTGRGQRHQRRQRRTQSFSTTTVTGNTESGNVCPDEENGDGLIDEEKELYEEEEKIDSIQLEFTHLLTSQLDTQRKFFEQKLNKMEEETKKSIEELTEKINGLENESKERETRIQHLQAENDKLSKFNAKLLRKLEALNSQLTNENTTNTCLQSDRDKWLGIIKENEVKMKAQETEIADLKEQLRDVMLYLDFGNKIQTSELKDEIAEGQISVPEGEASGNSNAVGGKLKGKGRKKH